MLLVVNYLLVKACLYSNDRFVDSILSKKKNTIYNRFDASQFCGTLYIFFRSMDQACCIVYNEQTNRLRVCNRLQGKEAENHCVTTAKCISTSLAIAARVTLSITRISKVSL